MAVLIATQSALVRIGDRVHRIRRRRSTAHAESPIVAARPDLWEPIPVDFPTDGIPEGDTPEAVAAAVVAVLDRFDGLSGDDQETARLAIEAVRGVDPDLAGPLTTAEPAGEAESPQLSPSAKDVRAWAKAKGVDVPARGKLPDEIIDRYRAALQAPPEAGVPMVDLMDRAER